MDSVAFYFPFLNQTRNDTNRRVRSNIRKKQQDIMDIPEETFIKNFRLNKRAFQYVLNILESDLPPVVRADSITAKQKLAACLRFFAEGSLQHGVGKDFDISVAQSTFSKILKQVLDSLERQLCPEWINLLMTANEKQEAKEYFFEKSGIPGVVMCVDGTHVSIKGSCTNPQLYYNRKGFYSLSVVLICDHNQMIRYVDARFPRSNHDSIIWNNTEACTYFSNLYQHGEYNFRTLGDAGYAHCPCLLTPFRSVEVHSSESNFNGQHSIGRNIVERTIGVLKNRFLCLHRTRSLLYEPERAAQIVNVCCALHDVCRKFKISWDEPIVSTEPECITDSEFYETTPSQLTTEAIRIRN